MKKNSTLKWLEIDVNQIGSEGTTALADALKQNSTLRRLSIFMNQIEAEGATALSDALKQNSTLKELYISSNQIGDKGARALADALKKNSTLTVLNISSNQIGDWGMKALADTLRQNFTLKTLYIYNNPIGAEGSIAMFNALKQNSTLTSLDAGRTRAFNSYIERNKRGLERARAAVKQLVNLYVPGLDKRGNQEEDEAYLKQLNETSDEAETTHLLRNLLEKTHGDFRRSYFRQMAYYLWTSRGDPKWWTPEERKEAGLQLEEQLEPSSKRRGIESCVSCTFSKPKFVEQGNTSRRFCGSYCQWIKHTGAPDLRGKSPKEIKSSLFLD